MVLYVLYASKHTKIIKIKRGWFKNCICILREWAGHLGPRALGAKTQQQRGMALESEQRGCDPLQDNRPTRLGMRILQGMEALGITICECKEDSGVRRWISVAESVVAGGDALRGISEPSRTNGPGPVSTLSRHSWKAPLIMSPQETQNQALLCFLKYVTGPRTFAWAQDGARDPKEWLIVNFSSNLMGQGGGPIQF